MRQITNEQMDAIADSIHSIKMTASVVTEAADNMTRPVPGDDWRLPAMLGERISHFAMKQMEEIERLQDLIRSFGVAA